MKNQILTMAATSLLIVGCQTAEKHPGSKEQKHVHHENCGHKRVWHGDHWDYIQDGEYHYQDGDKVVIHGRVPQSRNIASEDNHKIHDHAHKHGKSCGHKAVPHDDHVDYIHEGHYHYNHQGHVDDHGNVVKSD